MMLNFKQFMEMWDTPGKQGEAATPLHKPSDGQPFKQNARGGKPRSAGSGGGVGGGMGGSPMMGEPSFMKKKMKKD